ncbi:arylamine N-acetyltransferase [Staphylococcus felis]|uniref:arylamine N-acetyltransferase n=1 Tax=Staphylococcus felis TaxID=46127 RepID=UPI000E223231|nr:arylamine N-acetyltransferase [Staphylococcus felis]REI04261.1 arylamine N-acetyltransferase [Staphylococcus felis]REI07867.1 arylamine N-acetyltransferase [Staphylococcus felis]REI20996.1 arylamine N-acetyltransferase [Staphylococcus felis]
MDFTEFEKKLNINDSPHFNHTVAELNKLIQQFMLEIPFENIDVQNGVPISTAIEDIYDKVVTRNRGGFCYELNGLFKAYLDAKGFETIQLAATVHAPDGTQSLAGSHLTLAVKIDETYYIADVGFGDLPMQSLQVTRNKDVSVHDVNGEYRAILKGNQIYVQKCENRHWVTQYEALFKDQPSEAFTEMIHYNQNHPDSIFVQRLIVTKPTQEGRVTMSNENMTIQKQGNKYKEAVTSKNYRQLLKHYFNIDEQVVRLEE